MCRVTPITPIQRICDKMPRPKNEDVDKRMNYTLKQLAKEKKQ